MKNERAGGLVRSAPWGSKALVRALCFVAACESDGAPGASGATGASGAAGASGRDGVDGSDGKGGADFDAGVAPVNAPRSISFFDDDPVAGLVQETAVIGKAANEGDVTSYAIYYGKRATEKLYLTPIAELPKTGADLTFWLATDPIPEGATHLLAYARNDAGESAVGVATSLHDGQATAALDSASRKLVVVSEDDTNGGKPSLLCCEVDGAACTWSDLSGGRPASSGVTPSLAVATSTGRFFAVTRDHSNADEPALFTLR